MKNLRVNQGHHLNMDAPFKQFVQQIHGQTVNTILVEDTCDEMVI